MSTYTQKDAWDAYTQSELAALSPIFAELGIVLDQEQKHMQGERYLMQAITTAGGKKLILTGSYTGARVVIKATRDEKGAREIETERTARRVLNEIDFAGDVFHSPQELLYTVHTGFTIAVQEFIHQEHSFLERPLEAQFALALKSFKAQESAHATTSHHRSVIKRIYGIRDGKTYLTLFETFKDNIDAHSLKNSSCVPLLTEAHAQLQKHARTIEQYCGFLTHTDFVPHNIRIQSDTIYLLDHSSLTFGNKYEGWARFLNFMELYNPPLTALLTEYVKNNRTPEELVSLRMMRIYRLGEILWYYTQTLDKSEGDLRTLNGARVTFWCTVLSHILSDTPVPPPVIEEYKKTRDALRSEDEKKRQIGLH